MQTTQCSGKSCNATDNKWFSLVRLKLGLQLPGSSTDAEQAEITYQNDGIG